MIGKYISIPGLMGLILVGLCTASGSDDESTTKRPNPFASLVELAKRTKLTKIEELEIKRKQSELEDYLTQESVRSIEQYLKPSEKPSDAIYHGSTSIPLITQPSRLAEVTAEPQSRDVPEWISDEWVNESLANLGVIAATTTRRPRIRRFFDVEARLMDNHPDWRNPIRRPIQLAQPIRSVRPIQTFQSTQPAAPIQPVPRAFPFLTQQEQQDVDNLVSDLSDSLDIDNYKPH